MNKEKLKKKYHVLTKEANVALQKIKDIENREQIQAVVKEYPYQVESGGKVKIVDIDEIIKYDGCICEGTFGLPAWGYSYGMGGISYNLVRTPEEGKYVAFLEELSWYAGILSQNRSKEIKEEHRKQLLELCSNFRLEEEK